MTPDVVVDVGNSRIKLGRCQGGRVIEHVSLPPESLDDWGIAAQSWFGDRQLRIAAAGVHPVRLNRLCEWSGPRGHEYAEITSYQQLPLPLDVDRPEGVGIDRLLGVLAASRRIEPGEPAVTVDVGTAVTVNLLTSAGAFGGGCILPGPWLMARALHEFTAKLPLVEPVPGLPAGTVGRDTQAAIRSGIQAAVYGAVERIVNNLADQVGHRLPVFVTGGGSAFLTGFGFAGGVSGLEYDERLVLDGIRLAAEALP